MTILERIQKQLDAGNNTAEVFDLKKAFNTKDYNILLDYLITVALEVL